jgi:diguanylate cyclase (GGDEF)-like protein
LNKFVPPGLALYSVSSSLGLFLGQEPFGIIMMAWLTGFVLLAFTLFYSSFVSQEPLKAFPFITLGVILLNFLIQVTGGIHSLLWPAYFLFAVCIAGFSPKPIGMTYGAVGLMLAIETANLLAPKQVQDFSWGGYAGYMLSLGGVSLTTAHIMHRIRKKEQQVRRAHEQLLAHAEAVNPLSDKTKLPALTREGRQAANVDAALTREVTFNGLLDFIYELVPAHTYALFLKEPKDGKEVLALRAIRSESPAVAGVGLVPDLDPEQEQWIIGSCAKNNAPRYHDDMHIHSMALGYYAREIPIRSFFAFPITDESGTVLGVLAVDSLEQGAFAEETREILERFTPFFIQIIERIRIAQELNVRASHFESLHQMSSILNSSLELDGILSRLAEQLASMVPHDLCLFLKYDEADREAVVLQKSGRAFHAESVIGDFVSRFRSFLNNRKSGECEPGSGFPVEENGILSQMLKQWKSGRILPYHFPDLGQRREGIRLLGEKDKTRLELATLSCWPLVAGPKFIGAFFLGSLQVNAFSGLQRNFLDTLMNQVAMVIDNSIMHRNIRDMARTDGLTGLLNHRTFMEKLVEEYKRIDREGRPFSILLMDIDKFKTVNDTYGHPVGDLAIKAVARVLKDTVRTTDFVARYGGEEFAAGMVDTDKDGAAQMAERVRKIMEKTVATRVGAKDLMITLSIGVSSFPKDTRKLNDLMTMADNALYQAKRSGRNRVCLQEHIIEPDPATTNASPVPHS